MVASIEGKIPFDSSNQGLNEESLLVNTPTSPEIVKVDEAATKIQVGIKKPLNRHPIKIERKKVDKLAYESDAIEVKQKQESGFKFIKFLLSFLSFINPFKFLFNKSNKVEKAEALSPEVKIANLRHAARELAKLFEQEEFKKQEGIFRLSARESEIQELWPVLIGSNSEEREKKIQNIQSPVLAAALLKKIYREEIKVFGTQELRQAQVVLGKQLTGDKNEIEKLKELISKLPNDKKEDAKVLLKVMFEVSKQSEFNKMTTTNLATTGGKALSSDVPGLEMTMDAIAEEAYILKTNEALISHYEAVFS